MLTRKHSILGKDPFGKAAELFDTLDPEAAMKLAMVAGDITLVIDCDGTIIDSAFDPNDYPDFVGWEGSPWVETVTIESRPKITEMLEAACRGEVQHWRQVNHPSSDGDIPVRYAVLAVNGGEQCIAFGRDLAEFSRAQQHLLQVQQSLERDYRAMRQLETRYAMLFEQLGEPVLIVEAGSLRIREANPAAHKLFDARAGSLPGKRLTPLIQTNSREAVQALAGAALASESMSPVTIRLAGGRGEVRATLTGFAQDRERLLMVRLSDGEESQSDDTAPDTLQLIDAMPDGFVIADSACELISANAAFVELVGAASAQMMRGKHLSQWIGRPGIDLELIENQIEEHGAARNVGTVVRKDGDAKGEPVEISAVRSLGESGEGGLYAFLIRPIARRVRDLPPAIEALPRSVDQLTEMVGRMSLKEITRESTELIERLCIEAALEFTSDNRASAAEILGLSRQSLYSKMHRYGIGNFDAD